MSFDIRDYDRFLRDGVFPFYFPVADEDGKVAKGCVLKPEKYFQDRGLDPRPYYMFLANRHKL